MFRSNTALVMERTEKMTEAMGTEGRQATLPRLSVTHSEERGSQQGRVRIPLIIRKDRRTAVILIRNVGGDLRLTKLYRSLH